MTSPRHLSPAKASPSPRQRWTAAALALLLALLVFALFAPSIRYALVNLDDFGYITQNRIVLQGLSLDNARRAFDPANTAATMYMPLLWISYMADVSLFGASPASPAPFHAVNVALHALSALLLFALLLRLGARPLWAFLLALLWAVHPLRVESVAWVTERKDCLAAFFGLSATLAWHSSATRVRRLPRLSLLSAAALLYALGLLAKPSLVPLPLAWLALDVWPLRRIPASFRAPGFLPALLRATAEKLLFLPFALAAAWMAVACHHVVSGSLAVPWSNRLAAVAPNFLFYVRKTILPVNLAPLVPEQWVFPPSVLLLSLAVCAAMAAALWRFRRAIPSLLPGAIWLLLFFLPASGLQPLPANTVADRFFYLPAIGLSIALAALPLPARFSRRCILHAACGILLAVLAVLSFRLLPVWRDSKALYARILSVFPNHGLAAPIAATNLIRENGDFRKADDLLLPILPLYPHAPNLQLAHAQCLAHLQSPEAAWQYLSQCPLPEGVGDRSNVEIALAQLELALGRPRDAIARTSRAIDILPADSTLRSSASCLLLAAALDAGDAPLALRFARQIPFYASLPAPALEHALPYAITQWVLGNRAEALQWFRRILDDAPNRIDLWNNIVWGLATASWSPAPPDEVVRRAEYMLSLAPAPDIPGLLDTVAVAHANAGNFDTAVALERKALDRLPPDTPAIAPLRKRLDLFLAGTPYRENAFERLFVTMFGPVSQAL